MDKKHGGKPEQEAPSSFQAQAYPQDLRKAKALVKRYVVFSEKTAELRKEISDIAIKVKGYGVRLTVFAEEIEINYPMLLKWISEHEKVTSKIVSHNGSGELNAAAVRRTVKRKEITTDTNRSTVQKIYEEELKRSKDSVRIENGLSMLKRTLNLVSDIDVTSISMEELKLYLKGFKNGVDRTEVAIKKKKSKT